MGMHLIMMLVMLLFAQLADMHFVQYVLLMLGLEVMHILIVYKCMEIIMQGTLRQE
jgi:hypothetical protein